MKRWQILAPRSADDTYLCVLQPANYKIGVDTFPAYAQFKCKKCKRVDWARAILEGQVRKFPAAEQKIFAGRGDCFYSTEGAIVISRAFQQALSELAGSDIAAVSITDDDSYYLFVPKTMIPCPADAPLAKSLQDTLNFMKSGTTPFLRESLPCPKCSQFVFTFTFELISPETTAQVAGIMGGSPPYLILTVWMTTELVNALQSRNDLKLSFE
jgi:hypothetical protein